jgi:D-amino peptidase
MTGGRSVPIRTQTFRGFIAAALPGMAMIAALQPAEAQAQGKRIFISIDMEGIAGAVTPNQISGTGIDYQRQRKIMTDELLAAIAGAREGGATEFVIADAHGDMQNILIEELPADVRLIRGSPRPLMMMEGIQNGRYDGAIFIGYHSSASNPRGVRAHTFSSARISEVKLNGVPASEGSMNAALAAQYGVPVILATGDDAAVEELAPVIPGAETVAVKRNIGFHAAENLVPAEAQRQIRAAATKAVQKSAQIKPAKAAQPVTIDLTFHFYRPAELLAYLPNVERTGARSVRWKSADMASAMKFMEFAMSYNVELQP